MTLRNNRAPLLRYVKLCASFQSHQWIQTGVTDQKHSFQIKIGDFFCLCDLEIWQLTLKKIGLLQALCIISKPSVHSNWIYSPETTKLGQNWSFFVQCDLEIWQVTLKNNKAHLCYFKLCASFHDHWWIQTVRKCPKSTIECSIFIPLPNEVGAGVYWIHLVRPSVCPSVRLSVCL